jgi:hypothetical protein
MIKKSVPGYEGCGNGGKIIKCLSENSDNHQESTL